MFGMEMCTFNMKDGYLGKMGMSYDPDLLVLCWCVHGQACTQGPIASPPEGIVRGHRSGLLTTADYNNLCQCENLEDIKLNLVGIGRRAWKSGLCSGVRHAIRVPALHSKP